MFYNGMSKGSKSARNNCRFVFMVCIQLISENYALKKDLQLVKVENTFNRCGISPLASKGDLLILLEMGMAVARLEMGMAVASCQVYLSFTRNCLIDFVKKIVFYSFVGQNIYVLPVLSSVFCFQFFPNKYNHFKSLLPFSEIEMVVLYASSTSVTRIIQSLYSAYYINKKVREVDYGEGLNYSG